MIDKATAIPALLRRLHDLEPGSCLEIRTYKRNRSVCFQRLGGGGPGRFLVVRDGFGQARFEVNEGKLKKALKTLLKQEFPRSTKIRVYDLGPCQPGRARGMKRL